MSQSLHWTVCLIVFWGFTLPLSALQHGKFTYTDNGIDITITDYPTSETGAVVIPESIGGKPVTTIGYAAFYDCSGLTSVTIPDGVTDIGNLAFFFCSGLTSVTIPDSVTTIGDGAFYSCSGLTSVTIPDSVTTIGDGAFSYCRGLTSVAIPDSVTSIGTGTFSDCSGLTGVIIPDSVTNIGSAAFYSCSGLTGVTIPDSVTSIGDFAFSDCSNLTAVTIPDSVTGISDSMFSRCISLTSVAIPDSVTTIGEGAFFGCSGLTNVAISDSVVSIGRWAFSDCSGLAAITVDPLNSVYSSVDGVLYDKGQATLLQCPGAKAGSFLILGNVTGIDNLAFYGCRGLIAITVDPLNSLYRSVDGVLFNQSLTTLILCPGGKAGSYPILGSVTSIGDYAFAGCSSLTSVTIPDSVIGVGTRAFFNCSGLTNVTIPDSVTTIGDGAFYGCSGLTSVTIPDSVTGIGNDAFADCSGLTSVTIPDSVTNIGNRAFSYCSGLTSVKISNSVTSIGDLVFAGCSGLRQIVIPPSVTRISYFAFHNCRNLEDAIFLGDMPGVDESDPFRTSDLVTVYFFDGSTGFTSPTWFGLPSVNMGTRTAEKEWLVTNRLPFNSSMLEDPNHDGVNLLLAYALNLEPNRDLSASLPKPTFDEEHTSLRFYSGVAGVEYRVEASGDLIHWTTDAVNLTAPDENNFRTATVNRGDSNRFLRLVVSQ